jgi:hypothetical protein
MDIRNELLIDDAVLVDNLRGIGKNRLCGKNGDRLLDSRGVLALQESAQVCGLHGAWPTAAGHQEPRFC